MSLTSVFLTFEGIDGAGKSSHVQTLRAALAAAGADLVLTREPGGTPLAEWLREGLLHRAMDPLSEALLMCAARRDHLRQVIEPALARGQVVLCDRFTDATFAYQGHGRGFDVQILAQLEQWVQARPDGQGIRQPDATFWFDLPPEVAAARLAGARQPDRFEAESLGFFQRVRDGYADRCRSDPERFIRIVADETPAQVWSQIEGACRQRGWLP